jgi:hypothetical protein
MIIKQLKKINDGKNGQFLKNGPAKNRLILGSIPKISY